MERRVKMEQTSRIILFNLLKNKEGSLRAIAVRFNIPYSTLKQYACGSLLTPEFLFKKIVSFAGIDLSTIEFSYLDRYWGARAGGKKAMQVLQNKYPEELIKWRKLARVHSTVSNRKKIIIPPLNEDLAEFIGIYLGDGTLTPYFIRITGDYRYDLPYFYYIKKLVFNLFGLEARIKKEKRSNAGHIIIFSKELCTLLHDEYKLAYGHKIRNNTLIPQKVLGNPLLALACLRGLMDTDGSISRRGRAGEQFTVCLSSYNKDLIAQVKNISELSDIFTYVSKNQDEIGTNSVPHIRTYFNVVGSSNLRHVVRFYERFFRGKTLYRDEVIPYYQQPFYSDLKLPFKLGSIG